MRVTIKKDGITVNCIAGAYVVFFGLDLAEAARKGFRGFAFKRVDHSNGEVQWMRGMKTFEAVAANPAVGENFSTEVHPIQSFQWADYSVKPGVRYTYTIRAMYGNPGELKARGKVDIAIKTESEEGEVHSAYFNRGSVATQEYARRFQNRPPKEVGQAAWDWLSRGLVEHMIGFIERAKKGDALVGAVYEFQHERVLEAIREAKNRGVKIKIIYDAVDGATGPRKPNIAAIKAAKIAGITKQRLNAKLMHNKFFVHVKKGQPDAVWTGSTNITLNGIFGHANVGHIVDDQEVALAYLEYYERLLKDPTIPAPSTYREENMEASPVPQHLKKGTTPIFSPRGTKLDSLDWYAKLASEAKEGLFMTFAFGMHQKFKEVYSHEDDILKMALMEKTSVNGNEKEDQAIQLIRNRPNVVVAIGNRIVTNAFDRWLEERETVDGKRKHVYWIHTKFMLIDPLGEDPIVVTGSANFSKASTDSNDENMLVIRGDKRIADIYFGEYMRLYAHYSYREAVKWAREKETAGSPQEWKPQYLSTEDVWMKDYFNKKDRSGRYARRVYFAGTK